MQNKWNQFDTAFWTISFLHFVSFIMGSSFMIMLTKPLLMPILIFYLVKHAVGNKIFYQRIMVGLIFSWLGDVFLMFAKEQSHFFMLGLISFLFGHIMYISAFITDIKQSFRLNYYRSAVAIIGFILCAFLYNYLYPHLGDLKIPVLVYALVLTTMAIVGLWRRNVVNESSYLRIGWIGGVFFMVSDAILANNKFVGSLTGISAYDSILVMFTYCLAQYGITTGALHNHKTL